MELQAHKRRDLWWCRGREHIKTAFSSANYGVHWRKNWQQVKNPTKFLRICRAKGKLKIEAAKALLRTAIDLQVQNLHTHTDTPVGNQKSGIKEWQMPLANFRLNLR